MAKKDYLDKRLIARGVRNGHLSREEVKAHLDSLKDVEENAVALEARIDRKYSLESEEDTTK